MKTLRQSWKHILQWFKNRKFRTKLFLSYLVLILAPVLGLGAFSFIQARDILYSQLEENVGYSVEQMAFNLEKRLEKNDEFIRFTAFSPYLIENFSAKPSDWLTTTQRMNNYFEPVSWYTMSQNRDFDDMKIYFENLSESLGSFVQPASVVQDEEWYQQTRTAQRTRWYFEDSQLIGTRRVYNAQSQIFLGAIRMRMDTEYIMDTLGKGGQLATNLFLTNESGHILYASPSAKELLKQTDTDETQQNNKIIGIGKEQYYIASADLDNWGWNVYTLVPITAYTNQVHAIFSITITLALVLILFLLGIIALFSTTMVSRIDKLNDQIRSAEDGNYSLKVSSKSKDEIGMLTNSFGRMMEKTDTLINQVYKTELENKEQQFKSLQSQINPHFLYNTLSLINWKAIETDNEDISTIAGLISTFYRTCLNKGETLTTVDNELVNIRAYIDIQQIMHDGKLDVSYDIAPQVLPAIMVNFTLQPLVENAIHHGLDENEGVPGRLHISACQENEDIVFRIIDNGVGMSEKQMEQILQANTAGYGVKNVHRRIQLHFGPSYGVSFTAGAIAGTVATLRLPYRLD